MDMGFPLPTIIGFCISIFLMLFADIYYHREGNPITLKSAISWSLFYIAAALLFAFYIWVNFGAQSASLFLSGYALEKVLAFDNLFVFSLIFSYFKISKKEQHKALHWGIAGAIVFRLIFVVIGVGSLALFGPIMEVTFSLLILLSIYLILTSDDENSDYNSSFLVKTLRRVNPGITPFFISIFVIEVSDIMFSFDSVPAIIAITKEPFLIYSSMIFAILGLRSMYFVLESLKDILVYMDNAIILVLGFIALKLSVHAFTGYDLPPNISLAIILSIISTAGILSITKGKTL